MRFSNNKIAKKLKISRNRDIDYLNMTPDRFSDFMVSLQNRTNKLNPYHSEILVWLKEYPDATSIQIDEWLQDKFEIQSVAENTIRNYVNHLREHYCISKMAVNRIYGAVDEFSAGQ